MQIPFKSGAKKMQNMLTSKINNNKIGVGDINEKKILQRFNRLEK